MPATDESHRLQASIILYQTEDGRTRIQCRFESETIWLKQALITELFQVAVPTVDEHLKGIFAERELAPHHGKPAGVLIGFESEDDLSTAASELAPRRHGSRWAGTQHIRDRLARGFAPQCLSNPDWFS